MEPASVLVRMASTHTSVSAASRRIRRWGRKVVSRRFTPVPSPGTAVRNSHEKKLYFFGLPEGGGITAASKEQREDTMKRECFKTHRFLAAAALCLLAATATPTGVSAQLMSNYTNLPVFLNQTVNPNILFLVDMGNYTLEAAYTGTNQRYWISFKAGTVTDTKLSANVT